MAELVYAYVSEAYGVILESSSLSVPTIVFKTELLTETFMQENIPQIIKDVGFDFSWDESKVWKLDVPMKKMNIEELVWHLSVPFLWFDGGVYNLTPNEVLNNPIEYRLEFERTMKADMKYPIDIMENKGRWLILDGLHRLMQASVKGLKEVNVRIVPREQISKITTD